MRLKLNLNQLVFFITNLNKWVERIPHTNKIARLIRYCFWPPCSLKRSPKTTKLKYSNIKPHTPQPVNWQSQYLTFDLRIYANLKSNLVIFYIHLINGEMLGWEVGLLTTYNNLFKPHFYIILHFRVSYFIKNYKLKKLCHLI